MLHDDELYEYLQQFELVVRLLYEVGNTYGDKKEAYTYAANND